ncbi:metal-dependent hydrolase [Psychroserpens algicola]|uniref:metal-dependent hydrolase n=1 Tax=Psychroserpens algicola TaxID=1719034 RepID=UPI0021D319DA|nr:metal-dependent hydrolase [Psychroserpens algicola]
MASIFGHGLVAYTTAKVIDSNTSKLVVFLAIGSAILPDIDVLGFRFGIDYMHPFGHRGFTHSIVFALVWSGLLSMIFGKKKKISSYDNLVSVYIVSRTFRCHNYRRERRGILYSL